MGGCRCSFRGCKVSSTRNPGMHFFHFPIGAPKHLRDWIRYSNLKNFLEIPESQQRNKVICARHFKAACFMNYKQDRLVASAIPTITRLNQEWALDYEQNIQNPNIIKMETTQSHLIPPPNYKDPQCFNADDLKNGADILEQYARIDSKNISQEPNAKRAKLMELQNIDELQKTENRFSEEFLESLINDDTDLTLIPESACPANIKVIATVNKENGVCPKEMRIKELETLLAAKNDELNEAKTQIKKQSADLFIAREQIKMLSEGTEKMKEQLTSELNVQQTLKTQMSNSDFKYNELLKTHNELKKKQEHMEASLLKQGKGIFVKREMSEYQPQQLGKQQLFNGIKRYLSQTMVALLRMQLASNGVERVWRPDEKRVATDLLGLGEHAYRYFTDEWLMRLPNIHQALDWLNENEAHDEEDIL